MRRSTSAPAGCSPNSARRPPDSGCPRQHHGPAGHLRQGRHRNDAGRLKFIDDDLPKAFCLGRRSASARRPRRRPGRGVSGGWRIRCSTSRRTWRRERGHRFRLGREKFEQKLRLDEGITLSIERLLAIATRELKATQEAFRSIAGRMNGGDPLAAWARTKNDHPEAGELVSVGRQQVDELADVSRAAANRLDAGR